MALRAERRPRGHRLLASSQELAAQQVSVSDKAERTFACRAMMAHVVICGARRISVRVVSPDGSDAMGSLTARQVVGRPQNRMRPSSHDEIARASVQRRKRQAVRVPMATCAKKRLGRRRSFRCLCFPSARCFCRSPSCRQRPRMPPGGPPTLVVIGPCAA